MGLLFALAVVLFGVRYPEVYAQAPPNSYILLVCKGKLFSTFTILGCAKDDVQGASFLTFGWSQGHVEGSWDHVDDEGAASTLPASPILARICMLFGSKEPQ